MEFRIENVPLPVSRPDSLSSAMRQLNVGQSFLIPSDKVKKNTHKGLYTLAQNVGIAITARKVDDGLRVWRVDPNIVNEAEIIEEVKVSDTIQKAASKFDGVQMNDAMAKFLTKAVVENPQPNPVEPVDEWVGWSEERESLDESAGETVTYREHIKTRKRKEIRRDTYYG